MYVYTCTICEPGAQGGQKTASDPLELEILAVMSHHFGSGNRKHVLQNQ